MKRFNPYPRVIIDLEKLRHNVSAVVTRCAEKGVGVAGVIKVCHGIPECTEQFEAGGCDYIASSRLEQLQMAKDAGVEIPLMMIRVPMLSEIEPLVEICDASLVSELEVLKSINKAQAKTDSYKKHGVILMSDLGDLREGFWDKDELVAAAELVENELTNVHLLGIGTNLGCYGSIAATPEKLEELVELAERIESKIGRKLEIISGGATSSFPRILEGNMPARVNNLRVGEAIVNAKDLPDLYGCDLSFMNQDVLTLEAEVIEVKDKPSHPVGEIAYDAFGMKQEYEDKGIRKRALLALGKVDIAFPDMIYPRDKGVTVLGGASDHLILDIEDAAREFKVGDIVQFDLCYATTAFVLASENVKIDFVQKRD